MMKRAKGDRRHGLKRCDRQDWEPSGMQHSDIACHLQHSVEAAVSCAFAWHWRTNTKNWNDPPARFQLHGPFASGSWGTTYLPGQPPLQWHIRDVRPDASFVIDMPLDRAVLTFEWLFEPIEEHRTRITQRITLSGDNAATYVDQVRAQFGATLDEGMKRIAEALLTAERSRQG
jgi:hypothetical protein